MATRPQPSPPGAGSEAAITAPCPKWPAWLDAMRDDPARAVVIEALLSLVEAGEAFWTVLESGDVRVDCVSGIVLHLGERGLARIR